MVDDLTTQQEGLFFRYENPVPERGIRSLYGAWCSRKETAMRGVLVRFAIYMAVFVVIDQAVPGRSSDAVGSSVRAILLATDWMAWALAKTARLL